MAAGATQAEDAVAAGQVRVADAVELPSQAAEPSELSALSVLSAVLPAYSRAGPESAAFGFRR